MNSPVGIIAEGTKDSGKSSLLELFSNIPGILVVPEAALEIIREIQETGEDVSQYVNENFVGFQNRIVERQLQREQKILQVINSSNSPDVIMLDRWLLSDYAYKLHRHQYVGDIDAPDLELSKPPLGLTEYKYIICEPTDILDVGGYITRENNPNSPDSSRMQLHNIYLEIMRDLPHQTIQGHLLDRAGQLADLIGRMTAGRVRLDVNPIIEDGGALNDIVITREQQGLPIEKKG